MRPILISCFGLLFGCMGSHHSATPIPKGTKDFIIAPGAIGSLDRTGIFALPTLELGLRYGVSEMVDLGIQTNLFGLKIDANIAPYITESNAFAVRPSAAVARFPGFHGGSEVVLLFASGFVFDAVKTDSLIFTLLLEPTFATEASQLNPALFGTFGLGVKFKVGETTYLRPSLDFVMPINVSSQAFARFGFAIIL